VPERGRSLERRVAADVVAVEVAEGAALGALEVLRIEIQRARHSHAVGEVVLQADAKPADEVVAPFVALGVGRVRLCRVVRDLGDGERARDAKQVIRPERIHAETGMPADRGHE
jgi:hypothetical protein